jgi:hypothetical protein
VVSGLIIRWVYLNDRLAFQLLLAWPLLPASIRSRVKVHRFLETLEGMSASLMEAKTRPGDQILDGSRDQHLARPRERRDTRGDMNGDAPHFVRGNFDLAGMQAAADLNAERVSRRAPTFARQFLRTCSGSRRNPTMQG